MSPLPAVLSIHAVDTCGEEGAPADAAILSALGCRARQVITALIAQGPDGIASVDDVEAPVVGRQLDAVLRLGVPAAVRIGIVRDRGQVDAIATALRQRVGSNLVVATPVQIGPSRLLDASTLAALRSALYPMARVVIARAADLPVLCGESGSDLDGLRRGAAMLRRQGAPAALVSGGSRSGRVVDCLDAEGSVSLFDASRLAGPRVPGVSGAHPATVAAYLALGEDLARAVEAAQRYVGMRLARGR